VPALKPYSYSVPQTLADRVVPGARVVVPVRSRELVGVVVDVSAGSDEGLRPVLLAPDREPLLPETLIHLGGWMSRYYVTPIGLTLRSMLPGALWGSSRLVAVLTNSQGDPGGFGRDVVEALARTGGRGTAVALRRKLKRPVWDVLQRLARVNVVTLETEPPDLGPAAGSEKVVVLTQPLPSLLEREQVFGRALRQRTAYEAIDAVGGEAGYRHLRSQLGFSSAVLSGLVGRGVARIEQREHLRAPLRDAVSSPPARPSPAQCEAVDMVRAAPPGQGAILFGVTGSGKTLVYLEAVREEVERGRSAIVLVPEIALTPQTIARVRGVFGDTVAVLHSGLSDAERADAWRGLSSGRRRVAVGARSAVFAPMRELAAIIVDEEHDASYKHGEAPRYHARDVAIKRAALERARVILGSATPSLETWVARDRLRVVSLPDRVQARALPEVQLIDMRRERRVEDAAPIPWSLPLDDAVRSALAAQHQIILLLNRRGFAQLLQCQDCGAVRECPHCSISVTVHQTPPRLRCHYCGFDEPVPDRCAACGGGIQRTRGVGTQQLEHWLATRYPAARLARMDADTTTAKWSHQRILDAVARHDVDILFGTQMISKGLDFPGVTLVGVVDADTALHLPDFRAAERTFQLIAQVAGRAGRGPKGGCVLVQTRTPDHYALQAAALHDYQAFADRELEVRKNPAYPPHVGLVNVVVSGGTQSRVADAACAVADWLRGLVAARAQGAVDVIGPAPAPLARIKRRWRWHLVLRAADRKLFDRVVRYAARRAPHTASATVRVVFDRDPVTLL
jgi:primosomal protein N' (replication factor Y)